MPKVKKITNQSLLKPNWFVKRELRVLSDNRIILQHEIKQRLCTHMNVGGHSSEVAAALVCNELIPNNGHRLKLIDTLLAKFAKHAKNEEDTLFIEHLREEAVREIKQKK